MFSSILFLSRLANSHAVLTYPPPFNPNPSKTSPCGGGFFSAGITPVLNLTAGEQLPIYWQVIAGDGSGTVNAIVSYNSVNTDIGFSLSAPAVGRYQQNLTVPNFNCSKEINPCIMHVQTTSSWYSCFAFTVGNLDPPNSTLPSNPCVKAPNTLNFCSTLKNQYVTLPETNSVVLQDAVEQNFYNSIIGNTNVISNGTNADCQRLLNGYLCLSSMPFCGKSASLTTSTDGMNQCYCEKMKATCGVTESHSDLFNCTQLISCTQTTSASVGMKWSAWWIIGLLLL